MSVASLFNPDVNCWYKTEAAFASVIIDCGNFYCALYEAISKASHSIFIVGWDIDSRIRLLHGDEEKRASMPSVISELLAVKAKENPDLQVYLVRWDSSLAFFSMREMWAKEVWDDKTPDNVHTRLDSSIPMGGSQHQKIIVIDDEVAFSGGMDVAINRWDTREHRPVEPERYNDNHSYDPLHDVQAVVAGPVVEKFAGLVRWRWNRVAGHEAIGIRNIEGADKKALPHCWPESVKPLFRNIDCAIARTIPMMDDTQPAQEVRHMLLDLIGHAQHFIYIENQFASREEIAEALNKRLKQCKTLRLLLVSTYRPKDTFECEFWANRVNFKKILESGIEPGRVLLAYSSIVDDKDNVTNKDIHSKVMAIDSRYLVIGSSNLSNRSMVLDTECDLIFAAGNEEQQRQIAYVRNDLISEHSGWSIDDVGKIITKRKPFRKILKRRTKNSYHLNEVEDELFIDQSLHAITQPFSDPEEPLLPPFSLINGKRFYFGNPSKRGIVVGGLILMATLLVIGGYYASQHILWLSTENVKSFLETTRGTAWALPTVCMVYIIAGLLFFPVTVLSVAVAAVFGPVWGPIYGMCGALLSAALLFGIGHIFGGNSLQKIGGDKVRMIDDKVRRSGIIGVAAIRLVPIAPYSLVNMVAGISSIGLYQFLAGTFLGMFPLMIAKGLVGDSLTHIFLDPSPKSIAYLVGGVVLWIAMIYGSQKLVNRYQSRKVA